MKRALTLFSVAALSLAACGSDDESVTVENAWARTSAMSQANGAVYFDLTVAEDDTLVAADVSDSVADRAEVHEVVMADMAEGDVDSSTEGDMADGDMDEMGDMEGSEGVDDMDDMEGMDGPMVMQELTDGLALSADQMVSFEPGGYHVMLLDLAEPLELGDEIDVTLEFAEAGSTTITVEVAESAP